MSLIVWPKGSPKVAGEGKYIYFYEETPNPKTQVWAVYSKAGNAFLGQVRWFAQWRQYSFFTELKTVLAPSCLRDIAIFCEYKTYEHKEIVKNVIDC